MFADNIIQKLKFLLLSLNLLNCLRNIFSSTSSTLTASDDESSFTASDDENKENNTEPKQKR